MRPLRRWDTSTVGFGHLLVVLKTVQMLQAVFVKDTSWYDLRITQIFPHLQWMTVAMLV